MRTFFGAILFAGFLSIAAATEYHVSPSGSDTNSGDATHAFRTVGKAVAMAQAGDTVWLHAGIYRESVNVKTQGQSPLMIAAAPGEKPQIFGSETLSEPWGNAGDDVFSTKLPAQSRTKGWLFIDDKPATLSQGPRPQKPDEFALEQAETNPASDNRILIQLKPGDRPKNHHFEWATRPHVLIVESGVCHLQGLDLAFAANDGQDAMVFLSAGSVMENCTVRDSLARGVTLMDHGTVDHCHVFDHGILGLGSGGGPTGVHGLRVLNSEFNDNSWYKADTGWESGGIKFSTLHDSVMRGNNVHDNQAWGIWLDWECSDNRIEGNSCCRNVAGGIFLEASWGRNVIANNICVGTRKDPHNDWGDGIFSHDSNDALVAHNLCLNNAAFGIRFRLDSDRKLDDGRVVECSHNIITNNICAGNSVGQVQLPPNAARQQGNQSDGNILFAEIPDTSIAETVEYSPVMDFAAWQKLGFDPHSTNAQPLFRDQAKDDFHPAKNSPQVGLSSFLPEVPIDFDGHPRSKPKSTAGPFEFIP